MKKRSTSTTGMEPLSFSKSSEPLPQGAARMPSTFLARRVETHSDCSSSFSMVTTTIELYPLALASWIMEPHISAKKGFVMDGSMTPIIFVLFLCKICASGRTE